MCIYFLINEKQRIASVHVIVVPYLTAVLGYIDFYQDTADGKIVYGKHVVLRIAEL